jgi:lysophospholipase L1-like esterase
MGNMKRRTITLLRFILICVVFVFLYLIYLSYPIYNSINISQKLISEAIPYVQHPNKPDTFILVAGDSTAVGVGSTDNRETIAGRLGQQFPKADITNLGISGARLKDLILTLEQQKNKHYDLIVLQIGANDITHFTPYDTIESQLEEVLYLSNQLSPKIILLTSGDVGAARVFRWPLSVILSLRTRHVRDIFMNESSKNASVSYIDLFRDPKDDPFEKDLKRYYAPDSFHLTGAGYGVWYSSIQKKL